MYVHAHVYTFGHCMLGGVEQKIILGFVLLRIHRFLKFAS